MQHRPIDRWNMSDTRFGTNVVWALASMAVLAVSGAAINLIVLSARDAGTLGVFNQTFAVYVVATQLGTIGIHQSVLRHSAFYNDNPSERDRLFTTAAAAALALGVAAALTLWSAAPALGRILDSQDCADAIAVAALGLSLAPLNKVVLTYLNGLSDIRAFALLQGGRYVLVATTVAVVALSPLSFRLAALCFAVAEAITTLAAFIYLFRSSWLGRLRFDLGWLRRHLVFGLQSFPAGLFVDLNARVDVLMLGLFASDRTVGIYSIAAMFADGLLHVLWVFRMNGNPIIAAALRDQDWAKVRALVTYCRRYALAAAVALAIVLLILFLALDRYVVPQKGLGEGFGAIAVLFCALVLLSWIMPFDNMMLMAGLPLQQTLQHFVLLAVTVASGFLLIPSLSMVGAALAVGIGYVAGSMTLVVLTRRHLGWDLLTNASYPNTGRRVCDNGD
jgi:O-antigen/teichoic acid export membrane protein